jgi:Pyruvate/2-oxoacid:ferredoxin oxidoreductase gamma subunit
MKTKFRLAGRGGQGIKFAGSFLAKAAMKAQYQSLAQSLFPTLSVTAMRTFY